VIEHARADRFQSLDLGAAVLPRQEIDGRRQAESRARAFLALIQHEALGIGQQMPVDAFALRPVGRQRNQLPLVDTVAQVNAIGMGVESAVVVSQRGRDIS
jgi:hypothetical protein